MNKNKTFVHRANYVDKETDPLKQLHRFRQLGFCNLEIDVTVTDTDSYKFCHPSILRSASTEYSFDSSLFEYLSTMEEILWLVDIKYLDAGKPPLRLVKSIYKTLGSKVVFSAALPQLLTAAHDVGAQTAQFFRSDISADLPFAPDYFIRKSTEFPGSQLDKTILYCESIDEAERYLTEGVGYVMIDGESLSDSQS